MHPEFENLLKIGVTFPKKNVKLPKNWPNITKSIYDNKLHKNFAILTGKSNNIIIIDLDNKDPTFKGLVWFEKNFGKISDINTLVTKTVNGGYHIYFKYTNLITNITSKEFNIDILSDKRCCYQGEGYPVISDSDSDNENGTSKIRDLTNSEIIKVLSLKLNPELLDIINIPVAETYDEWFKIGVSLIDFCKNKEISLSTGLDVFKIYSMRNKTKYDAEYTVTQWEQWCNSDYDGKKITEKTIINKFNKYKDTSLLIEELDIISQQSSINFHDIKHIEILKKSNVLIEALMHSNGIDIIHNMVSKKCKGIFLYSDCSKDGYKIKCRNCDFVYPPENIPISRDLAPNIFNLILINQEDNIKNKQTKAVAEYLLNHTTIIYNNKNWYQFNTESGIYEKQDELVILRNLDVVIDTFKQNGQTEEWFKWMDHINYQKNLLEELKKQCFYENELDSNKFLLGFNNGIYDLENDTFRIGKIEDYVTMKCGCDFNTEYSTELASHILQDIFPIEDERNFAICKLALTLEGYNREQKITFNYGYTASNGKSFIMEIMRNVMGDYGDSFPVTVVTGKMKEAGDTNSTLSGFRNKRFLYCSEPEAGLKINSNYIKTLTGDTIKVRALYSTSDEEIKPTYKMFMCCNTLPNFDTYDEGIARRVSLLEYKTKFCEEPKRKHEKLLKKYNDYELDEIYKGFTKILIDKYNQLKTCNFKYIEPEYLKTLCKLYVNDNKNVIKDVLLENFEIGESVDFVKIKDIKSVLKKNGIVEKDVITLKYIVEDMFEGVEFKDIKKINNKQYKSIFINLKLL